MTFFKFMYDYGFYMSLGVLATTLFMSSLRVRLAGVALQVALASVCLYSGVQVRADRLKPHYKAGDCFTALPGEFEKPRLVMMTEIGQTDYKYVHFLPEYNRFVANSEHPSHMSFNSFEAVFPLGMKCPDAPTYIIGE